MDSKTNYKNMLLALLLILAGLAGAIVPQQAAAKVYTIMVGDVQITSGNAANITGPNITGKVSFDESTYTLILNNATIDGGSKSAIHTDHRRGKPNHQIWKQSYRGSSCG